MNSLASMAPPISPGVAVVVVADRDARARAHVVVGVEIEESRRRPCRCALADCGPPSRSGCPGRRKQLALRVQQQARRFDRRSRRRPPDPPSALARRSSASKYATPRDRPRASVRISRRHAPGAQFAVAGGQRRGNHGVLRAALGVHLAGEPHAPAAAHARPAPVVGHAVAQHREYRTDAAPAAARPA